MTIKSWGRSFRHLASRLAARVIWVEQAPAAIVRNLRWFWFDGVFSQASEAIINSYLSLFLLAMGASRAQIGLLSSISNLSAALLMLPGAALVERLGHRKEICVWSGGGIARIVLLLLALSPLMLSGPAVIYLIIGLAVVRVAFSNLTVPAWVSLTADLVPLSMRGRYLASRNMAMGVVGMISAYLVGQMINRVGSPLGYQLAIGLAFVLGMASTGSFARIQEPPAAVWQKPMQPPVQKPYRALRREVLASVWQDLRAHPAFLKLCAVDALWNFWLNVAGPFFSVYLVENLGANAGAVGALAVVNVLASLPGQRLFGILTDRWGPRRVQILTGLLIPLVPWGWALARLPWHVVPSEIASGFLWAGYGLASFNLMLRITPEDRRPRYTALYQIVVMVALAAGAAVGGVIATQWGYRTIMILSGAGRLIAALFFVRFVRLPAADQGER